MAISQVYCLPDNYEVSDRSLDDIRHVLSPTFSPEEVREPGSIFGSGHIWMHSRMQKMPHAHPKFCVLVPVYHLGVICIS